MSRMAPHGLRVGALLAFVLASLGLPAAPAYAAPAAPTAPAAPPAPATGPEERLAGCREQPAKLLALDITGCTTERCGRADVMARLRELTDLEPGRPAGVEAIRKAAQRIEKTGLAVSVRARCAYPEPGKLRVTVEIEPQRFVSRVHIEGNKAFYGSDIRKRMLLEPGLPYTPGSPAAKRLDRSQLDALKRLYREAGFDNPRFEIATENDGDEGVEVTLRITEGPRKKIGVIRVDLGLTSPPERADLPGCRAPTAKSIRKASGFSVGGVYTERKEREARRRIQRWLRSRGYVKPRVGKIPYRKGARGATAAIFGDGIVEIGVRYEGCYEIRLRVRDSTADPFFPPEKDDLLDMLTFGESGSYDWEEARFGREALMQHFQARGHLFARVDLDYRPTRWTAPDLARAPLRGVITYRITAGPRTEIRGLRILGLSEEQEERALALMETRPYDAFGTGGYLLIPRLLADLERVAREFRDDGYLRFRYESAGADAPNTPEEINIHVHRTRREEIFDARYQSIAFRVRRPLGERYIYIEAEARPGRRTSIGAVEVDGARALAPEQLLRGLPLRSGAAFSKDAILRSVRTLRARYMRRGHLKVKVQVACASPDLRGAAPQSCLLWRQPVGEVDVALTVEEGPAFRVGEVLWTGNFRTRDGTLLRDLPEKGALFNAEIIRQGLGRLRRLGVFTAVRSVYIGHDETPPRPNVAMVVQVHEAPARFLDFALGIETISREEERTVSADVAQTLQNTIQISDTVSSGQTANQELVLPDLLVVGEAAYVDLNFLGRAQEIQIPIKYGLSTTELNRLVSFTPTWVDRRLFGSDLRLRVTPFVVFDRAIQALDTLEFGLETEVSKRFFKRLTLSFQYEVSGIKTAQPLEDLGPLSLQQKPRLQLVLDLTDSPVHPTEGQYLALSMSYINAFVDDNFEHFLKFDARLKFFQNLRKKLILGLYLRLGRGVPFGAGGHLPDNERFVLGGNKGVRGYDDDSIVQYTDEGCIAARRVADDGSSQPIGFDGSCVPTTPLADDETVDPIFGGDLLLQATVELRFPVLAGIWGSAFWDVGALAERFDDLRASSFRHSVGFGLRYLIDNSIPIRLDYGIKVNRRCRRLNTRGLCGQQERFGNLHFGVLYTF